MSNKIEITCDAKEFFDIMEFTELQGSLKELSDDSYERLKASILEFGFAFPVLYCNIEEEKYIMDGHGRIATTKRMMLEGYEIGNLPASEIYAKDKIEAKKKLLALNSRYGEMTMQGFDDFIKEDGAEIDIEEIDFFQPGDFELEDYLDDYSIEIPDIEIDEEGKDEETEEVEEDKVEDVVIKYGDLIKLGKHMVLCGNPKEADDVAKVTIKDVDAVISEIPKNLKSANAYTDYLSIIPLKEKNNIYMFIPDSDVKLVLESFDTCEITLDSFLVWVKNNHENSKKDYAIKHSLIAYGWKGAHKFYGDFATTVFEFSQPIRKNAVSKKPDELICQLIIDGTPDGGVVYDGIGGVGDTLIACEETGRVCALIEKDQANIQKLINRYVDKTESFNITINGKKVNWMEFKKS